MVRDGYRAPPSPVANPPPARSHNRPSAAAAKPAAATSQATLEQPLHQPDTFPTHGWSFQSGNRNSRALATSWLMLAMSGELKQWQEKRGGSYQHDTHRSLVCSHMDELRVRIRSSSEALGRSVLHGVEVDATSLQLVDIKLLRTASGQGQEVDKKAMQGYTVLLFLTPTNVHTSRMEAGGILVLNTAVPHFAIANTDQHDCFILCIHFGVPAATRVKRRNRNLFILFNSF